MQMAIMKPCSMIFEWFNDEVKFNNKTTIKGQIAIIATKILFKKHN